MTCLTTVYLRKELPRGRRALQAMNDWLEEQRRRGHIIILSDDDYEFEFKFLPGSHKSIVGQFVLKMRIRFVDPQVAIHFKLAYA